MKVTRSKIQSASLSKLWDILQSLEDMILDATEQIEQYPSLNAAPEKLRRKHYEIQELYDFAEERYDKLGG